MAKYISSYKKWVSEMVIHFKQDDFNNDISWHHITTKSGGFRLVMIDVKTEKAVFFTVPIVPPHKGATGCLGYNPEEEKLKEYFAIAYANLKGIEIPETKDVVKLNNLSNQQEFFDECGNKYIYIGKFKDKHSVYSERDEANILLDNIDVFVE